MERSGTKKSKNRVTELTDKILPDRRTHFALLVLFVFLFVSTSITAENVVLQRGTNLFSYPTEPSQDLNCADLKATLGADQLSRLDGQTQLFRQCNEFAFPILPGVGYVLNLPTAGSFDFAGTASCPSLDLVQGINLIGVPTPPAGMGCYDLLKAVGNSGIVSAIQRFNTSDGSFQSCAYDHLGLSNTPLGTNFPIIPGEAYWVSMLQARQNVVLNDQSQCAIIINPPGISDFTPKSGSVGTLVTLQGNNFNPRANLVPKVTMARQGGGTIEVPVARFNNTQIQLTIPTSAETGTFTVTVGEQSTVSNAAFTVEASSTFGLLAEPASVDIIQGHSGSYSIGLQSSNGFAQLAALSVEGLPQGMTALFEPELIAAGQKSLLTLTAAENQPLGSSNFKVIVTAEVNGIELTDSVDLTITVQPVTTTFMGRAVVADTLQTPLAGVTVTLLGRDGEGKPTGCTGQTTTDAAGNFAFTNLPPECTGNQLIRYDGLTVTNQLGDYAGVDLIYNITDGQVTESPVLVHLPRIDDKETVMVKQNWPEDQHFTFSSIPNLEATVYAGTILTLVDGSQPDPFPLTAIDVPVDRLPEEMPPNDTEVMPFIVAFQPANAEASQPVAVTFPNLLNVAPGSSMDLSTLDPTKGVMVLYGTGTVSEDGAKIIPDLDPAFPGHRYGLVHFDWHGWLTRILDLLTNLLNPGPLGNGVCPIGSKPIDPSTGIEILRKTDIAINGPRGGISIQRIYRTLSNIPGPFGIGANHNYGYRLDTNTPQTSRIINLVMPEGNRYPFITTAGSASLRNLIIPAIRGAEMTIAANGEVDIRWKNGTIFHFVPSTVLNASELESITDANGNKTLLIRNPAVPAQITEVVDPVGRKLKLTYDGANRVTSITDPIGRRVAYTYNAQGTLETVTDPEGGITRYDYDAANRLTQVTDARGVIVAQNTYDANGRAIKQIQADGGSWLFDYTLLNPSIPASPLQQTIVTDPMGNSTTYRFNPQTFLTDVTDVRGQTSVIERESGTNLKKAIKRDAVCDVCGVSTAGDQSFTYDDNGNLLTTTDALGNTSSFNYDPVFNKITAATDPLNQQIQLTYDNKGNLTTFTDQNGETTALTYQAFGLLSEIEDPLTEKTTLGYDAAANLASIVDPLGNVSNIQYDAINRPIGTIDALGHQSLLTYDNLNRVLSSTDAQGQTTTFTYDAVGNLLTLTDAKNQTTTFTYDAMNRLATRTDPLGQIESFNYDLNGNLISMTDRRGQLSQFSYDKLNRLITETYADGGVVQRDYDQKGNLILVDDSNGGIFTFTYDALGQLISETTPFGQIAYSYDARGQMLTRQVVGQPQVDYDYDPAGNLLSTVMPQASATMTYDERNLLIKISRSNGVTTDHTYDPLGRLSSITHANGATTIDAQTYDYDAIGNRIGHSTGLAQPFITQPAISTFDNNNRLLTRNGTTYTYGANGNRATETDATGVKTYTWDSRNRLTSLVTPSQTITFRYDFAGNLIQQTTTDINGPKIQNFLLDDLTNVVHESRSNGADFSMLTGRSIDSHLAVTNSNGTAEFGLADGLNNTIANADQTGTQTSDLNYEPFGEATTNSSYTFQYTGRVPVSKDLYYYRARFYDPTTGQFISEDPIGIYGGDTNFYRYVRNNPINFLDSHGLQRESFVDLSRDFLVFIYSKNIPYINKTKVPYLSAANLLYKRFIIDTTSGPITLSERLTILSLYPDPFTKASLGLVGAGISSYQLTGRIIDFVFDESGTKVEYSDNGYTRTTIDDSNFGYATGDTIITTRSSTSCKHISKNNSGRGL